MYAFHIIYMERLVASMARKYEITDIQHPGNPKLFRIRALRDIPLAIVNAGDLGGYVENENNLSQEDDCWIGMHARVYENAKIYENAQIYGNTLVYGNTRIFSEAQIAGNAKVFGEAQICDRVRVFDKSQIFENAKIYNTAWLSGDAQVSGNAQVSGDVHIRGDTILIEDMRISGGRCVITSLDQIYYADGVTAYFDLNGLLRVNGNAHNIEHHETLARLKLL